MAKLGIFICIIKFKCFDFVRMILKCFICNHLILLAAIVWFFFRGIPLEYYDNNLILYSALGGFLFFIFSFQFFGNYNLIKDNTKEATEGKKTAPLMIIPAVVFSIALIFNNEIEKM
jgi:hypothetical protein